MSEATLAIRPNEIIYLDNKPFEPQTGEHLYQVALVAVPPLPEPHHWPDDEPFAVVCIQVYTAKGETAWGFIALPPESKGQIGDLLLEANAKVGKWYWLLVSSNDYRGEE